MRHDEDPGLRSHDYVVDEAVQVHGMGYSAETRAEHAYRDARINRIFEGTNEINRMLTVDMILKKAMKGELDLMTPAMAVVNELTGIPEFGDAPQMSTKSTWATSRTSRRPP